MNEQRQNHHHGRNGNLAGNAHERFALLDEKQDGEAPSATPSAAEPAAGPRVQGAQAEASASVQPSVVNDDPEVLSPQPEDVDDGEVLGSSLRPEDTYRIVKLQLPEPAIDGHFIQAAAMDGTPAGERRVAAHHTATFLAVHGMKIKVLEEQEATRARDVAGRERECVALTRDLEATERFHRNPAREGAAPWNWHDRVEVAITALVAVGACVVNICNSTNVLHGSGEPMFATLWQTLPMAAPLILGAVGLKLLARLFRPGWPLRAYGYSVFFLGLAAWSVWMFCFSANFAGALASVQELMAQHRADGAGQGQGGHGQWVMLTAGLADALLAAGAWIICQIIVDGHHLARAAETPEWQEKRRLLNRALKRRNEARNLLGIVRGELERERNLHARFVSRAVEFYRVAAAQHAELRRLMS